MYNLLRFLKISVYLFCLVIRPWRLQPDAQKNVIKKCDPVALYQKYQQEWKQISFPGEAKHSKVRWAVREKMLGVDPHPMVRLMKIVISNNNGNVLSLKSVVRLSHFQGNLQVCLY